MTARMTRVAPGEIQLGAATRRITKANTDFSERKRQLHDTEHNLQNGIAVCCARRTRRERN
jgi:hypothetical protein